MIPVTKPFLPPKEEYNKIISKVWDTQWLTNMGPMSIDLEQKLKHFLNVNNLLFVTNGTVALQMAIKSLELCGEIITTPFSFVATTSSVVWEGCTPVFCDISPDSFNIDVSNIESLITDKTTAILATHVYGNPCDVLGIQKIAKKYKLKVIYDGAHAFGVKINGESIFNYGDISICSLHATKLYHSIEGGFIVTKNNSLNSKLDYMRNFGFDGPEKFAELGINGKNSEFHAAMGLLNLGYFDKIHQKRKLLTEKYDFLLPKEVKKPLWNKHASLNYAYYPIVFNSEEELLVCVEALTINNVFARRYFYPSLSTSLPYVVSHSIDYPTVEDLSKRVLCLPLYYDLTEEDVKFICEVIVEARKGIIHV